MFVFVNPIQEGGSIRPCLMSAFFKIDPEFFCVCRYGVWVLSCSAVEWLLQWPGLVGGVGSLWPGEGLLRAEGGAAPTFVTIPVMTGATCTNTATPLVPAPPPLSHWSRPTAQLTRGSLPPNFASHISWSRFFTKTLDVSAVRWEVVESGVRRPTIQQQHCCKNV